VLQQVEQSIEQNKKLWTEIHECIRTNDLKQLMTLLSQHTINLNSFNLSTDGDTILHSAAKSNDVKMMEFVLQRISPLFLYYTNSTMQRVVEEYCWEFEMQHVVLPA
jgi:ankyrin repeat protein